MQSLSSELARSVLDAAPDAIIIIDGTGRIRFANGQVSSLFGYRREEIIGLAVEQLMPERFRSRHNAHRERYAEALRPRAMGEGLALFGRRLDGSEFPVEVSLSPIRNGKQLLIAAAIRDVSDRKRVENELRAARALADEARESADRANQAKSRFLATASHDLRQPLQTLALLNGILRRVAREARALEALDQQEQAIGAMTRLLGALLDISKLESGAIKPELGDFKVGTLFEGLRREFSSIATSKNLELEVSTCEECVHSDAALVEQLIKNLLSNAIKYTRPGGRVLLRGRGNGDRVQIDVVDTGIGIAPDQIAYIYDEFYQVGVPTNSSREGYGLGLSIVQRLVKLLNLRLEVTSELGKGSVFSLLLPRGQSERMAPPQAAAASRESPAGQPRVLLVEDDPGVRDATRMLLRVEGYQVTAVASLADALRSAQHEGAPDLLITDYHLGEGELGTEVIAALREKLRAELKAVLITGDTSNVVKHLPNDPRLRVAAKPIDAEQLLKVLGELLTA
ncbi:MAG TPA: PAS domain S-box protein [Steroidobacteraceae bacterium]|jgi:PAS domain S-box-containing protein|nr:PAS domain S-box protein [Steroidobacteraceae bacterium]